MRLSVFLALAVALAARLDDRLSDAASLVTRGQYKAARKILGSVLEADGETPLSSEMKAIWGRYGVKTYGQLAVLRLNYLVCLETEAKRRRVPSAQLLASRVISAIERADAKAIADTSACETIVEKAGGDAGVRMGPAKLGAFLAAERSRKPDGSLQPLRELKRRLTDTWLVVALDGFGDGSTSAEPVRLVVLRREPKGWAWAMVTTPGDADVETAVASFR